MTGALNAADAASAPNPWLMRTLRWLRYEMRRVAGEGAWEVEASWLLQGSGSLALRGYPVTPGDVDVFVRPWLFKLLEERSGFERRRVHPDDPDVLAVDGCALIGVGDTLPVMVWERWDDRHELAKLNGDVLIEQAFGSREWVADEHENYAWPVIGLNLLVQWKEHLLTLSAERVGRGIDWDRVKQKHRRHLTLIESYGKRS